MPITVMESAGSRKVTVDGAATLPYIGLMLLWLALVTYIPSLSLWWRG